MHPALSPRRSLFAHLSAVAVGTIRIIWLYPVIGDLAMSVFVRL